MSLILEALKRSESERIAKSQNANSLVTSGISSGEVRRESKPLLPLLIAALLINLIVLAIFLIPNRDATIVTDHPAEVTPNVTSRNSDLRESDRVIEQPEAGPRLTLETPTRAEMPLPREVKAATALAEELLATPRREQQSNNMQQIYNSDTSANINNAAPEVPAEFAMLDTEEIAPSAELATANPLTLRELDNPGLADQLSKYEINTHIFNSGDAARSFVLINMKKYREGDTLQGSNFTIASITNEGVVINHDTGQVLLSND